MVRSPVWMRAAALLPLAMVTMLATAVPATEAARCHYVLGFKALHAMAPAVIGACLGDEQHNPANGDATQVTKKGLLVWRKADNQVAFTDGYLTILDGPRGLEERPNTQRFAWEANPAGLPLAADTPVIGLHTRRAKTARPMPTPRACSATPTARSHHATKKARKATKRAITNRGRCRS